MQKSITSINPRGPLNVTKIKHSASFDTGHTRTVFCLLYLGNRLAATGSDDGTIKIWDIITFGNLGELKGHSAGVRALAMLGGGNIASCSWDKTIKIWRTQSLTQQSDIEREQEISNMGNISTISFNGKNNDPNDVSLKTLVGHTFPVLCVQVLPDGKSIISGSSDYTVRMWDSESGSCLKSWTGHQSEVLCLAHTKFSNLILSGSGDRTVKVWNCDKKFNNASVKTLSGHSAYVWTIVILPDDSTVVSGSLDKSIKIWEIESGECLKTLKEHFGQILSLKVYKDDMLISADSDGNLKIWSISKSWAPITSLKKSDVKSPIYGVEVTEDFMILTTGADKRLSVWN